MAKTGAKAQIQRVKRVQFRNRLALRGQGQTLAGIMKSLQTLPGALQELQNQVAAASQVADALCEHLGCSDQVSAILDKRLEEAKRQAEAAEAAKKEADAAKATI